MLKGVCCKVWCIWLEKRDPIYHHNFKAGAMNASIRVSSNISNGQVLLNLDCDISLGVISEVEFRDLVWMVLYILEVAAFTEEILFNTGWGKEIGLKYGCPVEDVITGLSIQCHGWRSVYCNPTRQAFLGIAPTKLSQTLVQVLLSEDSPAYAHGKIGLGLQLGYCCYCFWASNSLATLFYSIIPSLYLLRGVSLFPQVSSPLLIPFAYVIFAKYTWSCVEFLWSGGTISDVSHNYEKEVMEFGALSPMFTILATLALLNLFCFLGVVKEAIMGEGMTKVYETMPLQILLCGVLILINLPLYQALYLRKDKRKMPSSTTFKSMQFSVFACICDASLLLSWVPAVCASYLFCHPCRIRFMLGLSD
ncbi:hypothetical protein L3X38_030591 [Prunus dulcis]|uniref:Cellulose synthase like E1 n=1 Tax=Prunus dulcis TaxID=3755 RepID=A0AAD4YU54_PRUDU|nr:hypothetical protein L3X38_030591 [Prunus dulcis]